MENTTTLRKLISEIDFNNKKLKTIPSWNELASYFNIYDLYWSDDTRLKCYFVRRWYCTDKFVGLRAYSLDGNFIAYSYQYGRKSDEDFPFLSKEHKVKLRDYLFSLVETQEDINDDDIIDDMDKVIPSTFKFEYNSQILHEYGILNGEKVKIGKKYYKFEEKDNYFHTVEIIKEDGTKIEVDCRDLDFEYNI
jgi:hypothetical protein